jgi:hypothetical protein
MQRVHQDEAARGELMLNLDEIARQGACKMLAQALQAEVDAYSKPLKQSVTKVGTPWSSGTATPGAARSCAGQEPLR